METSIKKVEGIDQFTMNGIRKIDLDRVEAWLYALGHSDEERRYGCHQIMNEGHFSFSNLRHRISVHCTR